MPYMNCAHVQFGKYRLQETYKLNFKKSFHRLSIVHTDENKANRIKIRCYRWQVKKNKNK